MRQERRLKNGTDYEVTYPKKTQNVWKIYSDGDIKGNYTGTVKRHLRFCQRIQPFQTDSFKKYGHSKMEEADKTDRRL
ncbi:MAG: hypothetical protein ACLU9V_04420 [Roseburia sp.]